MRRWGHRVCAGALVLASASFGGCGGTQSSAHSLGETVAGEPVDVVSDIQPELGSLSIRVARGGGNKVLCRAASTNIFYVDRAYRAVYDEMTDGDSDSLYAGGRSVDGTFQVEVLKIHGQEFTFAAEQRPDFPVGP